MSSSTSGTRPADASGERSDRFGNPLDPIVGYARGQIITSELAEAKRQQRAYAIIRDRYARMGDDGVFNLTGLIRAFPFKDGDDDAMRSYVHFVARSRGELEHLALSRMGGTPEHHDGFLSTRVTAGMIAVMLTLLKPGDRVVSLVAGDRSHPSVKQAVLLAQGTFEEATDVAALEALMAKGAPPAMLVVTLISPSKNHLPQGEAERAVALARRHKALVVLDDAHMAARISLYNEAPGLALADPDVAVWSLDKHLGGPRSGFVAGRRELAQRIRARALSLGLEAQLGQYIAGTHAVEAFDPEPIRKAAHLSERVLAALAPEMDGKGYLAGAGLAVSGEDFFELALRRARRNTSPLVPIEGVAFASMSILESHGAVTIPAVGMPGAACTFRLMMYPDGERLGETRIIEAWHHAIDSLTAALDDPERVRKTLMG
ncbi:MAG: aminotransferase class I/II-fold pyridoxal phosphate-dependent enzyme [Hyphomicrobiaceae bacterium]|nr:aminotransferase class I/II-fold pyridoxal phosphate-dependent enzyme [Hyphomicrobiaceae bacterium]